MKSSVKFDIAHVLMATLFQVSCVSCNVAMVASCWTIARVSGIALIISIVCFFVFKARSRQLKKKGR